MINALTNIASECLKNPRKPSFWSPELGKYVCPDTAENSQTLSVRMASARAAHPPINPQFKLVFLTAAGGTILFAFVCLLMSLLAGREPQPLFEKVMMGFFDLAKIGFGAIVGLLGGKHLQGNPHTHDS